jgi:pyruvate/2-oxoglutarate/acetoin dehydrogenase E1 component
MYIGKLGDGSSQDDGIYILLKETIDNCIDEYVMGYGKTIEITIKEKVVKNIGEFRIKLGQVECLKSGSDVTLVTYGSCCRIASEAAELLQQCSINVEIIDVQTLLPFDTSHDIVKSVQRTNRVVFLDEDVPGGASAYMLQQVLEIQSAYKYLDSQPITITAKAHRPAYSTDGDYFSKPSVDDVFSTIYHLMHEVNPQQWPELHD